MEIIHLLRKIKWTLLRFNNRRRYSRVSGLRRLLKSHSNLHAILVAQEGFVLSLKNGTKFEWNIDKPSSYLIALDENYEKLEQTIIQSILSDKDVVFDIGANFGYFSVWMKKAVPSIHLHSFEPIKDTYATLLRNLDLNELDSVISCNFGFSNENKEVIFHIPEYLGDAWASMGTGVSKVYNYRLNKQLAQVQRLDDYVEQNNIQHLDFIKCDVEGAEKLVMAGGFDTLKRDFPTLMLEIGNMWTASFGYNREGLINWLMNEFEYHCFGVMGKHVIELTVSTEVENYDEQKMYNYFFVHSSKPVVLEKLKGYLNLQ